MTWGLESADRGHVQKRVYLRRLQHTYRVSLKKGVDLFVEFCRRRKSCHVTSESETNSESKISGVESLLLLAVISIYRESNEYFMLYETKHTCLDVYIYTSKQRGNYK